MNHNLILSLILNALLIYNYNIQLWKGSGDSRPPRYIIPPLLVLGGIQGTNVYIYLYLCIFNFQDNRLLQNNDFPKSIFSLIL